MAIIRIKFFSAALIALTALFVTLTSAAEASQPGATQTADKLVTVHAAPDSKALATDNNTPTLNPADQDPYQGFNRAMFQFNDVLDTYLLKPVAKAYNIIIPKPLNQGIHNVFLNIGTLPTIANDLLQLHFYQFANDGWRFAVNSTLGIGGLFDVAARIDLPYYSNDFGLTLARYGYTNSNYLVLPFYGPKTIRDGLGLPVDYYAFSIYPYIEPSTTRYEIYAVNMIDKRAQLLQYQSVMDEAILDKYVFMRSAYMQARAFQIKQNAELGLNGRIGVTSKQEQNYDTSVPNL